MLSYSIVAPNAPNMDSELDWPPRKGKTFDDLQKALTFWKDYGVKVGFNVRRQYFYKNKDGKLMAIRYVCNKEGFRKLTQEIIWHSILDFSLL